MNEQAPLLRDGVLDGVVKQEVTFPGCPMILARLAKFRRRNVLLFTSTTLLVLNNYNIIVVL